MRSIRHVAICLCGISLLLPAQLPAQTYPSQPIRLIVPYAPGGNSDTLARILSGKLAARLGQPVVVDNRPSAGSILGTDLAAKAPPDGYTLAMTDPGPMAINPALFRKLPYQPGTDLAPVALLASVQQVLLVHPSVPARSVQELVALAKAKPGGLNYASFGIGSIGHLATELIKSSAGIDMVHVPYKGTAQATAALLAGEVAAIILGEPAVLGHVKAGRMRALATLGGRRSVSLPDVPTMAESGIPGFDITVWFGVVAPARTSGEIIAKLAGEISQAFAEPDVKEKLANLGFEPRTGTPAQLKALVERETRIWATAVKASGARLD